MLKTKLVDRHNYEVGENLSKRKYMKCFFAFIVPGSLLGWGVVGGGQLNCFDILLNAKKKEKKKC